MTDTKPNAARDLAQRGLRQQQAGDLDGADRSLQAAMQRDPDAVLDVLHQTGADTAPDSRDAVADRGAIGVTQSKG